MADKERIPVAEIKGKGEVGKGKTAKEQAEQVVEKFKEATEIVKVETGIREEYDLSASKNILEEECNVGQLYPVLKDAKDRIIDGFHRTESDPEWEVKKLPQIKTDLQYILAKIHANWHRRQVKFDERQADITRLAELLKKAGVSKNDMVTKIAHLTGFQDRWIRMLLPTELKREYSVPVTAEPETRPEPIRCNLETMLSELMRGIKRVRPEDLECKKCPARNVCSQAMAIKLEEQKPEEKPKESDKK